MDTRSLSVLLYHFFKLSRLWRIKPKHLMLKTSAFKNLLPNWSKIPSDSTKAVHLDNYSKHNCRLRKVFCPKWIAVKNMEPRPLIKSTNSNINPRLLEPLCHVGKITWIWHVPSQNLHSVRILRLMSENNLKINLSFFFLLSGSKPVEKELAFFKISFISWLKMYGSHNQTKVNVRQLCI